MNTLRRSVNKHPLVAFVIAAYVFSWWSVPFANGGIIPYGPFIAAMLVLSITRGRAGLADMFRRTNSWQGGWIWMLVAPGLVVAYLTPAFAVNLFLGGTVTQISHASTLLPTFLLLFLLGGMWEEPGWSGFALPLLQARHGGQRYGLLKASCILALIRGGWHLPLVASGAIPWFDAAIFAIAFQFLISWLHNRTGGSALTPMVFHLTSNVVGGGIMISLFTGMDRDRYYILFIVFACMLALLLNRPGQWSMGQSRAFPAEARL
jgi:uncharacterized protein